MNEKSISRDAKITLKVCVMSFGFSKIKNTRLDGLFG
jgi:hypothetical protein